MRSLLANQVQIFKKSRRGQIGLLLLLVFFIMAIIGPFVAPFGPQEKCFTGDEALARFSPPTAGHIFGTTWQGRDVLSQVLYRARSTFLVGIFSAIIAVFFGANIGLLSGYFGGVLDDFFMRVTDIAYGMPFLPFVLVLIALTSGGGGGGNIFTLVIGIAALLWRTTARTVRAEVMSIKQREFVTWARSKGGSHLRILYKHIAPNVLPIITLYTALSMVWAVLTEASVTFLGFGNPATPSWGFMLYRVFISGAISFAWWWIFPPAICIVLFVLSGFLIGQAYEEVGNPKMKQM